MDCLDLVLCFIQFLEVSLEVNAPLVLAQTSWYGSSSSNIPICTYLPIHSSQADALSHSRPTCENYTRRRRRSFKAASPTNHMHCEAGLSWQLWQRLAGLQLAGKLHGDLGRWGWRTLQYMILYRLDRIGSGIDLGMVAIIAALVALLRCSS